MGGRYIGVGVSRYDEPCYAELPFAVTDVEAVGEELSRRGFQVEYLRDPTDADVRRRLQSLVAGCGDAVVVYWAGHGVWQGQDDLRLIVRDTSADARSTQTAQPAQLAEEALAAGGRQVLLILDTCHSGAAVVEVLRLAARFTAVGAEAAGDSRWIGVVASSQSYENTVGGRFAKALLRLLREGPSSSAYKIHWSAHNEGVRGVDMMHALWEEWPHDVQLPWFGQFGWSQPMFPNPRYRADAPERLVEQLQYAARGVARDEDGWYFTGRRRLLTEIVGWLAEPGGGIFVITGPPGSGKSAVLGRVAALSDPTERANLIAHSALRVEDPDPGEGTVNAVLELRGQDGAAALAVLARQLSLPPVASVFGILDQLVRSGHRPVILIDGLDEAQPTALRRLVEELVVPLAQQARILVGTRPARVDDDDTVVTLLSAHGRVWDLAADPDTAADLADYVAARLAGTDNTDISEIAKAVIQRAVR